MMGTGQSVGGLVTSVEGEVGFEIVGKSKNLILIANLTGYKTEIFPFISKQESIGSSVQLQRIISRCKCQFFYAHYGEVDPSTLPEVPLPVSSK